MNRKDFIFTVLDSIRIPFKTKNFCRVNYSEKEQHKPIALLCSGPSMNDALQQLISKNVNMDYFAVNDFAQSDYYGKVEPKYYVMLDNCYWIDEKYANDYDVAARKKTFESIKLLTKWDMTLYIPLEAYKTKYFQDQIENPHIVIKPYNYFQFFPTYSKFYNYILENNWGCVPVGNVLGGALYLSINMGYKEIYLYGVEHSWLKDIRVNKQNQVCTIKRHFYGEGDIEPWKKSNGDYFKMYELLNALSKHFRGYVFLEWYARNHNAIVVNCTEGSYIDAFERFNR